jgi:hypothetical protein
LLAREYDQSTICHKKYYDNFEKYCHNDDAKDINTGIAIASNIKGMLSGEDLEVNEAVLKNVIFNIECIKAQKK